MSFMHRSARLNFSRGHTCRPSEVVALTDNRFVQLCSVGELFGSDTAFFWYRIQDAAIDQGRKRCGQMHLAEPQHRTMGGGYLHTVSHCRNNAPPASSEYHRRLSAFFVSSVRKIGSPSNFFAAAKKSSAALIMAAFSSVRSMLAVILLSRRASLLHGS